jgi:hypothetical protein
MRVVVAIKGSGRGGASNAARYIAESKLDPGREGEETRKLFSEREDGLSYRKADRYLSGGRLAPEKSDLIHFSVSFQAEDFAQLGSSDEERKQILRGAAREAMDQLKTELRAGDWRWAAGVHLNTDHPHLHVLIHKEIVDRETEKPRRIGRIPKRLLAHRESVAGGELRSVEGVLGQWFLDSLDRARPQEREAALDNPGKKNDSAARARALSSSETLSLVAEKNPSIAGRELLQEIIERGPAPEPKEPPEVRNPRVAFKSRGFDDPDYRSRPEQADWLGHESRDLRELYERGASVVGDVLIIPAEEHEITNSNEEPFITSLAYALNRIKNPQQAQEFHALARTIAGETADAKTLLEVFRYYYARSQQDEAGRHISPGKKDERDAAIGRTIEEMRPLAGEMAMLETRESLEVALPTVSLDERHEGQDGESSGRAYNIAARKVSLSDDSLRFPAGLDLETKERLVGRTAPAIDKLLEGGSSREQVFASIDLSLYPPDLSERELEERSRIGRFLKAYVNERLKDPETRALNRSAAFRQAHSQITQARTPEDLNRAAESFLRENFASFRGNAGKPEEKPLNARERALLFSGRAPNHHTAEMRELRYAWGLSRVEREQRVEALRAGMLTPSPALEAMLTELGNRSTSPALRHYRASILSPQMRNPGKLDLRRLHQRLPKYERDFLFQKIEEREKGLAADRVSPPLSQSLVPAQEPAAKAPADAARPSGSIGEYQQAVEEIDSLRAGLIRDRNRWVAAAGNRAPKSERKSADRRVGDLTAEREQDRRILGDVLLKTAARDCAVLDFETARDHGETFRFKVYDASLNTQRRISSLDVERRAGARADRAADLHGATSAEDRHAIHQKVAREDLAGHAQTLKEHEKTRERLIGKLEAEATEAQAAHGQAQRLAEAVVQKYVQRGETLPSPFVERKALMATLEKAVDHRFADHTEKLERLRGDLAQEHKQLMRSDREAARLAAQLFIAETELGAREERAERFARTRHLTKWEIGGEKLSLADVDRRIERQTDEARLMGRFQMHLDPYARAKASEEIERLSVVREEILVKIGERRIDRRPPFAPARGSRRLTRSSCERKSNAPRTISRPCGMRVSCDASTFTRRVLIDTLRGKNPSDRRRSWAGPWDAKSGRKSSNVKPWSGSRPSIRTAICSPSCWKNPLESSPCIGRSTCSLARSSNGRCGRWSRPPPRKSFVGK